MLWPSENRATYWGSLFSAGCWSLAFIVMLGAVAVFAQEVRDAEAAQPLAAKAQTDNETTIAGLVGESGWLGLTFMAVLGLFSFVGVSVAIERLVNLSRNRVMPFGFVTRLDEMTRLGESDAGAFRTLCNDFTAPISNILQAGLLRAGRPLPEVEKSMEDAASREMASLRGRVRPLNVIGSVAPLVGLLGTVVGMILAFQTASQSGTGKAELLAKGIYLALLTTAAGLSIAIPAMLLAAYFNARAERFMREMDEHLMNTMPSFARMEQTRTVTAPITPAETSAPTGPEPK